MMCFVKELCNRNVAGGVFGKNFREANSRSGAIRVKGSVNENVILPWILHVLRRSTCKSVSLMFHISFELLRAGLEVQSNQSVHHQGAALIR